MQLTATPGPCRARCRRATAGPRRRSGPRTGPARHGGMDPMEVLFGRSGFAAATFPAPGPSRSWRPTRCWPRSAWRWATSSQLDLNGARVPVVVEREVPYLPGLPTGRACSPTATCWTRAALLGSATNPLLDEWWLQVPDARAAAWSTRSGRGPRHGRRPGHAREAATEGPLRVGVQAALWIVTVAALALAVAGFAMSATVAVRTRRLELARLQALGAAVRPGPVGARRARHPRHAGPGGRSGPRRGAGPGRRAAGHGVRRRAAGPSRPSSCSGRGPPSWPWSSCSWCSSAARSH